MNVGPPGHAACPVYGPRAGVGSCCSTKLAEDSQQGTCSLLGLSRGYSGSPTLAKVPLTFAFNERKLGMFPTFLKNTFKNSLLGKQRKNSDTEKALLLLSVKTVDISRDWKAWCTVRKTQASFCFRVKVFSNPPWPCSPPLLPPRIPTLKAQRSVSRSWATFQQLESQWGQRFLHLATHFTRNCGSRSLHGQYTPGEGKECGSVSL